jgi:hypothetical protein
MKDDDKANQIENDRERNSSSQRSSGTSSTPTPSSPQSLELKITYPSDLPTSGSSLSQNDQFELEMLRKQVEAFKLTQQILLRSRAELESKYDALLQSYLDLRSYSDSLPRSGSPPQSQRVLHKKALVCRHYLKGRCRYKTNCKFSHELLECPHCGVSLHANPELASMHLSECYDRLNPNDPPQ